MTGAEKNAEDRPSKKTASLPSLHLWNVAAGNFFFRYRNALFPFVFLLVMLTMRPKLIFGSLELDAILRASGVVVALAGEGFRLLTIGCDYIHRGGKDGQVYANRLVQGGVYAATRNPMYVGNASIAIGMVLFTGSPLAYALVIPFFLFVYQSIVATEEEYLRKKFGGQYDDYCAKVNRFAPHFRDIWRLLSRARCDWRRAVRRDLSTIMGLVIGLFFAPVWRTYFLEGAQSALAAAQSALVWATCCAILYGLLIYLKKRKRLLR